MRAANALLGLLLAASWLAAGIGVAAAEKRVALIVGNSAYEHIARLRNPANDAADLTEKLKGLGFETYGGTDLDRRSLVKALIDFGRAAGQADTALFFYAGHGLQVNGENYLVPVDALVEFEEEIDISLVTLSNVMRQLERGSKTNLIFLDACRDNPFADKLQTASSRSAVPLTKGLTRIQSGRGTFIAFATQPDAVASDGTGRNSPFTSALLANIDTPGQTISDMMIEVRNDVIEATNNAQIPWDSSSLTGRFAFAPGDAAVAAPQAAQGGGLTDKEAYELAVATGSCGAMEAFIRRFPDSFFVDLARDRAKALCAPAATAGSGETEDAPQIAMVTRAAKPAGDCSTGPNDVSYCATSVLAPQGKNRYDPAMLFDGKGATAWVENHPDAGLGESIMLDFGQERLVAGFDILNGYSKDEKTWANNSRVRGATLTLSSGQSFAIELPDVRDQNRFAFSRPVKTGSLTIRIDSVYRGAKFADTAISELAPVFAD